MSYQILCAASDTPDALKQKADFICDEADARPILQQAIDEADRLGVSCVLMNGTYRINSTSPRSTRGGICFYNNSPEQKFYSQNNAHYHVLEGARIPLGFFDGAVITMGRELYDSLSDDIPFSLFYAAGEGVFGRGFIIKNITIFRTRTL